jgi:hypothetical protein
MASPSLVTRTTPTGWKMPDGFKTLIGIGPDPGMAVWEKTVKPPPIDGGDGIDTTTMHNIAWRTKDAKHLKTLAPFAVKCAYDPDVVADLILYVNQNTNITVKWPDHSTLTFFGFISKAEFGDLKEGEFPEVDLTFTPTNWDPTNFVEAAPVFTAVAGT